METHEGSNATCTTSGYRYKVCTVCDGGMQKDTIPAKGHSYPFSWTITRRPTCTVPGSRYMVCNTCGEGRKTESMAAFGHATFSSAWQTVTSPTCTASGLKKRPCAHGCGYYEYGSIDRKPHSYPLVWTTTKNPTCTASGSKYRLCNTCGGKQTEVIAPLGHRMGGWQTLKAATCTESGTLKRSCLRGCGHNEYDSIPRKAHSYPWLWTVSQNSTCTAYGSKYRSCYNCGGRQTESIPPQGHWPGVWQTLYSATCTASGTRKRSCIRGCGHNEYESIPQKAHSYYAQSWGKVATASVCRSRKHQCYTCGTSYWEYDYNHYFVGKTCWDCGRKK